MQTVRSAAKEEQMLYRLLQTVGSLEQIAKSLERIAESLDQIAPFFVEREIGIKEKHDDDNKR